ncbi:uncharacterized protein [Penaeus vannamei]|uniref:uncharacterized protein isoform X1 n=1 Tax=Penaeus vannamei TaxID=6689 RepID=UPI00387F4AE3
MTQRYSVLKLAREATFARDRNTRMAQEEELLCPLCSELYEEDVKEPVLLPRCGHVFCKSCLTKTVGTRSHFPCPTCRKRHLRPHVSQLPVHIDTLARAEVFRDSKGIPRSRLFGICENHGEVLEFWCRDCQAPLCGSCPVKKDHDVVRTRLLLQEKKMEIQEQGNLILQSVVDEKKKIIQKVKKCSLQLLRTCEESSLTTNSAEDVKVMMGDTKKTADVSSVLGYLARMKTILGSFKSAPEDTDAEGKASANRHRRTRNSQKQQGQDSTNSSPNNTLRRRTNAAGDSTTGTPRTRTRSSLRQETKSTDKITYTTTNDHTTNNNNNNKGLETALLEPSLWPLKCCAYAEDGRKGELKWEDKRLHLYALGNHMEDAHFMIKLSVLQALISQDNPEVFMELTAGEQRLGRIYIRLWGHLRRAQNFLAMCTGTHGPSYRGAKFQEVFARGIPGECLHAGLYPTPDGGTSAKGVVENLEWDGKFKKPQKLGLVVGAGSGRPDRDACFDICTIENPQRNFACPFGEVVGGWDVVMKTVKHKPVRAVTMQEVGVVIPDLSRSS